MILSRAEYPEWLLKANIVDEVVAIEHGMITLKCGIWKGGTWKGGTWLGGIWEGGIWEGGTWEGGTWEGGLWKGGTWLGGKWLYGIWEGGTWEGGLWKGGTWEGGVWKGGTWLGGKWLYGIWEGGIWDDANIDHKIYMMSIVGIFFTKEGFIGYRKTRKGGRGCFNASFIQEPGLFVVDNCINDGKVCTYGIHVCSLFLARCYFTVEPEDELWEVKFNADDICGFNHQQAKLRSGFATRIDWPWIIK
jgi:hypothetical protein